MYRITWLARTGTGFKLYTLTTPCAFTAITTLFALKLKRQVLVPRLWTRNNALVPA